MNTRDVRRQRREVPMPAAILAAESETATANATPHSVRNDQRQELPQQEALQPLIEYVVQELLARLLADLPNQCVIHVSLNARGTGQFEVRRAYPTLDVAKEQVQRDIADMVNAIRAGLRTSHVKLASDER
ncbi:MAG TPA: hypothetical protein VFU63_15010 [Ktedonobacterales bacterium]|nr:hypothetical protein [Ktedonobacterales bacterium]